MKKRMNTTASGKDVQHPADPKRAAVSGKAVRHPADSERAAAYAGKLSRMVRYDTTSYPYSEEHPASVQLERYHGYHKVLEDLFPVVHEKLEKVDLDGSLLYIWPGKNHERPVVLMGHQDVVPVAGASWGSLKSAGDGSGNKGGNRTEDGNRDGVDLPGSAEWEHGPFSGEIAGGKVWGRGSVDTKCSCMAFFQAVEELLAEGITPDQDVYLSTSCTEEWGGPGCNAIIAELQKRGVRPWLVCDEGGGIYTDPMPGVRGNFAMIGVGEKGRANVRFIAKGKGGHASTPQKNSPIARLAAFVCAVEKHSPFRSQMEPETRAMLEALAPAAVLPVRLVLQNLRFFKKPVEWFTPGLNGRAAAMLGTTITFTMASGSDACNVFPAEATLGANMRFVHHQDMDESLALIRRTAAKYGLEMEVLDAAPCTKMVDINGQAYRFVEQIVHKTFPGMGTSPYILTAATDAAFYDAICDNCIRFAPIVYGPEEKKGIHGTNEALPYDCLPDAVDFYKNMILENKS